MEIYSIDLILDIVRKDVVDLYYFTEPLDVSLHFIFH